MQASGPLCKLLKALYGLKQAPRHWHPKIHSFLVNKLGFTCTAADACLYIRHSGNRLEIIPLYVDDLLIAGNDAPAVADLNKELGDAFEVKDLGAAKMCLGLEICRNRSKRQLFLGQQKYVGTILERFCMQNCKAIATPMESGFDITQESESPGDVPYREAIGSLMYLGLAVVLTSRLVLEKFHSLSKTLKHITGWQSNAFYGTSRERSHLEYCVAYTS